MKKGERLEISLSVLLLEQPEGDKEMSDAEAEAIAQRALIAARAEFNCYPLHFRRLSSGITIGPAKQVHRVMRRAYRRRDRVREGIPGEVCTCLDDTVDTVCPRHPYLRRRKRTETPPGKSGKAN